MEAAQQMTPDETGDPFILGVNYWPRRKAMYWWSDFDGAEVADEFDVIKDLGMGVVRIFLLWDDWQPSPNEVPGQRLRDLEVVADTAAQRGLGLEFWLVDIEPPIRSWTPERRQVVIASRHGGVSLDEVFEGGVLSVHVVVADDWSEFKREVSDGTTLSHYWGEIVADRQAIPEIVPPSPWPWKS